MESYEQLLDSAYKKVKVIAGSSERFEIPKAKGHVEGNKTIITNFFQIASAFQREPDHLLKFLLKELATPGSLHESRLILGRKITSSQINEKIERYAKVYVLCYECGKPDTKVSREEGILTMKCSACGAKHPVR